MFNINYKKDTYFEVKEVFERWLAKMLIHK